MQRFESDRESFFKITLFLIRFLYEKKNYTVLRSIVPYSKARMEVIIIQPF